MMLAFLTVLAKVSASPDPEDPDTVRFREEQPFKAWSVALRSSTAYGTVYERVAE